MKNLSKENKAKLSKIYNKNLTAVLADVYEAMDQTGLTMNEILESVEV